MSCAVEDRVHRAKMTARTTSETAACAVDSARAETEAYMRAELPSESPDRTSNRVNDHDAVDGSRLSTRPSCEGKDAVGACPIQARPWARPAGKIELCDDRERPREHPRKNIYAMIGRDPESTREECICVQHMR